MFLEELGTARDHGVDRFGIDLVVDVVGDTGIVEHVRHAGEVAELGHHGVGYDERTRAERCDERRCLSEGIRSVDDVMGRDKGSGSALGHGSSLVMRLLGRCSCRNPAQRGLISAYHVAAFENLRFEDGKNMHLPAISSISHLNTGVCVFQPKKNVARVRTGRDGLDSEKPGQKRVRAIMSFANARHVLPGFLVGRERRLPVEWCRSEIADERNLHGAVQAGVHRVHGGKRSA